MKDILFIFVICRIFSFCYGQNLGGQAGGGEVVWNDNMNLDEMGSAPMISISSDTPSYPVHIAVLEGSGGAVGGGDSSKSVSEGQTDSSELTKVISRFGYDYELECKIEHDDGAPLEVKWYKNNELIQSDGMENGEKHYKFKDNTTLVIQNATKADVGDYKCQAEGFTPPKSKEISVVYLRFKSFPKSTMVLESDKMNLTCDVEGEPMPTITWFKDKVNVEEAMNSSRYTLTPNLKGVEKASFIVDKAEYVDRAEYMCLMKIKDVQYNTTTFVRVKDMYAALWPFLGICAEVFILCLIIFIYEKRRAKAEFDESDTDQPPEQKNTSEQNKDSVRQRK